MADRNERIWSVYIHTNKINHKRYVGITSQSPEQRWGTDGVGYNRQMFYRAIEKYGWDNFDHDVVASGLLKDEADSFEQVLISQLKSNDKEFGYNIQNGGFSNGKHSKETIKKMVASKIGKSNVSWIGRKHTDESKQKMREWHEGRKFTEEHKKNLSESQKGKCGKQVICNGVVFDSIGMCAEFYGEFMSTMSAWLNETTSMPQKYIDLNLQFVGEQREYKPPKHKASYKVYCDGKVFDSIAKCSECYNVTPKVLTRWLKKRIGITDEFIEKDLMFYDEYLKLVNENKREAI